MHWLEFGIEILELNNYMPLDRYINTEMLMGILSIVLSKGVSKTRKKSSKRPQTQ
jgi:hypothetical protein